MKVDFYLQYYDYDGNTFDVSDDYYKTSDDYMKAMSSEYESSKDVVYNAMQGDLGAFGGGDGNTIGFNARTSEKEDKMAYSRCPATLYNSDGDEESVDTLIEKYVSQDRFVEMIEFDLDECDEEFEGELSMWLRENERIAKYGEKMGEEWTSASLPRKDLRLRFTNKGGEEVYAVFERCVIIDSSHVGTLIVLSDKITLVDNFLTNGK